MPLLFRHCKIHIAPDVSQAYGQIFGVMSWLWSVEMSEWKINMYKEHRLIRQSLPERYFFRKLLFVIVYVRRSSKVSGMAVRLRPAAKRNAMRNP